jgi:hypothetical protein
MKERSSVRNYGWRGDADLTAINVVGIKPRGTQSQRMDFVPADAKNFSDPGIPGAKG